MIGPRSAAASLVFLLFLVPVARVLWMTSTPGRSHQGPLPPLTPAQTNMAAELASHVRAIASEPHNTDHPEALERAACHIEAALAAGGYRPAAQHFTAAAQTVRNIEAIMDRDPALPPARS
jgi:hypothetical protein